MRYLFVLERNKVDTEALISELGVADVRVIGVAKSEREVGQALLSDIVDNGVTIGFSGIERGYRRSFGALVFGFMSKDFRKNDVKLREWLAPPPPAPIFCPESPKKSFENIQATHPSVVFADGALDAADNLAVHRWSFVSRAAQLLADQAAGKKVGSPREWHQRYQVLYARNGNVIYKYDLPGNHGRKQTDWHLKEGDATTAEGAARVYFDLVEVFHRPYVLVFYVGPHPKDGTYHASFSGFDSPVN